MKVILTEKINKLGKIGDTVEVKTGYARNYLLPNNKALRYSNVNVALFESKKAELQAAQDAAKKDAESKIDTVKNAKLHMIRQAGDTGNLYGSVSSRDIARMVTELTGVSVGSAQVLLGTPIKAIGKYDTQIALHSDVIVPVKVFVAQTEEEIEALVAGKELNFGPQKIAAVASEEIEEPKMSEKVETEIEVVEESAE